MKKHQRNWEETVLNISINAASSSDAPLVRVCDTVGARIATTLLADLSEEERLRIAEHTQTCPACAARFQEYQFLEAFTAKIPNYDLFRSSPENQMRSSKQRQKHVVKVTTKIRQKEWKRKRSMSILVLVSTICLVPVIVGVFLGESKSFLITMYIGLATLAVTTIMAVSQRHSNSK